MLYLNEDSPIEQLRKLAVFLDADFNEGSGVATLSLDNKNGLGYINTYSIYSGLTVRTYNVRFAKETKFSKLEESSNPVYFLYCVEGYYYHKFEGESSFMKINKMQNIILTSAPETTNEIVLPANVKLRFSVIFLQSELLVENNLKRKRTNLEAALQKALKFINDHKPYRYFGDIDPRTAEYAEILVDNQRTDAVGKLLTEGAIMNTLASQLTGFDRSKNQVKFPSHLSKKELSAFLEVGDYVIKNMDKVITVPILSEITGLSDKKLQACSKYLYGETLNVFIANIRLERAKELIQTTNLSISEICYYIGINNRSYFSKRFYEKFSILPIKFKKSLQSKNYLYELSYTSTPVVHFKPEDLIAIVETATTYNKENNITGCLVFHDNVFFQIMEGPKDRVLQLYENIKKDSRHKDVQLIGQQISTERIFGDWELAVVSDQGNVNLSIQGKPTSLNIDLLLANKDQNTTASDVFWRRIRNIIKVSG
ncbi:BLUF domain-containing protein [Aquimarina sp. ERC-38]|uniref:BLUF domain-containing protein n=1 Tax=Aquimarina sp. ERC-38 TaxID=2949996 RepID=UPI00224515AE|nr:BLUF domain-containing protein [Aquimarina sp. ERC-38]UZO79476.1 BLUF domain-containing protein [Aquimarina sp. ERC-38]